MQLLNLKSLVLSFAIGGSLLTFVACSDDHSITSAAPAVEHINTDSPGLQPELDINSHDIPRKGTQDEVLVDLYANFAELEAAEPNAFEIETRETTSPKIVIAIHGGGIEQGTTEIADAIAGTAFNYYAFNGIKNSGNYDLHITSTNFDEPTCVEMVEDAKICVSVHGYSSMTPRVYVGGLDILRRNRIYKSLIRAGFPASLNPPGYLAGVSADNICNKTTQDAGVQLEISRGLRLELMTNLSGAQNRENSKTAAFAKFCKAVRTSF